MSTLSLNTKEVEYENKPFYQTVIVTGGATGIGYAVADSLSSVRLTSCSTAVPAKLAGATEKLGNSDRVAFIAADITQPANAQIIVDAALERFGRLDVLVNNAGIFYNKPFTDYSRRCSADRTGGEINVWQANARLASQ